LSKSEEPKFWENGIQFECQGSGKCCSSHGEYGYVYMTKADRKRMAEHLNLKTKEFTNKFCRKTDGYHHLKLMKDSDACLFLENKQCSVYEGRPTQCRTWPFWPEVMNAKTWRKEVADFCPGVGKGKVHSKKEIESALKEQIDSENND